MPGIISYQFLDRDGNVLSSNNSNTLLMPASNMKIVSGFSAYRILGRNYVFKTDFSVAGEKLIVSGDPTFLLNGPRLLELAKAIGEKASGVKEIILDTSCMDSKPYGDSWFIGDRKYTYQSKISPFSVNEGSFAGRETDLDQLTDPHAEKLKPVGNQLKFFAESLWKALGFSGKPVYRTGKRIQGKQVFSYEVPLVDLIRHIETVSCNFSIEVLTKLISHKVDGRRGTWNRSLKMIYGVLKQLGFNTAELRIKDGSGLSRLNLLTTGFLSTLVHRIQISGDRDFLKLLPAPGEGSLKTRLGNFKERGLHAKTGSIEYCASLTGFIERDQVSFSIIINHSEIPDELLPAKIDEILSGKFTA